MLISQKLALSPAPLVLTQALAGFSSLIRFGHGPVWAVAQATPVSAVSVAQVLSAQVAGVVEVVQLAAVVVPVGLGW